MSTRTPRHSPQIRISHDIVERARQRAIELANETGEVHGEPEVIRAAARRGLDQVTADDLTSEPRDARLR